MYDLPRGAAGPPGFGDEHAQHADDQPLPELLAALQFGVVLLTHLAQPLSPRQRRRQANAELLELFDAWRGAGSTEERRKIWDAILALYSDQVYSIGLISGVMQPVAARTNLRNLPTEAVYNWEPGAQLGIDRPDTFWFDRSA